MTIRALAAIILVGLLFLVVKDVATADAAQLTGPDATWARTIDMHAPGPSGPPITVTLGSCPGLVDAGGCWRPWDSKIYITTTHNNDLKFTYGHELGHAFDSRDLTDKVRAWFLATFGYPPEQEWTPVRPDDDPFCLKMVCPSERFANVYALCALGMHRFARYDHGDVLFWGRIEPDGTTPAYYSQGDSATIDPINLKSACRVIGDLSGLVSRSPMIARE